MTNGLDLSCPGPSRGPEWYFTMRDSTSIFDQETDALADAEADLTREFWGEGAGWVGTRRERRSAFQQEPADEPTRALRLDHPPASMRAIRDGIAAFRPKRRWRDDSTGPIERTREHGVVGAASRSTRPVATAGQDTPSSGNKRPSPDRLAHRDATIAELAAGRYDRAPFPASLATDDPDSSVHDDDELIPLTPTAVPPRLLGSVDPRLVRITLVVIAVVLAVPIALALRDDAPSVETDPGTDVAPVDASDVVDGDIDSQLPTAAVDGDASAVANGAAPAAASTAVSETVTTAPLPSASTAQDADASLAQAGGHGADAAPLTESHGEAASAVPTDATAGDEAQAAHGDATPTAATVAEEAEREMPDCSRTYPAAVGDSWYRVADEAGVTPAALLEQNRATLDTVILPGDEICLPAGAAMPSPPTTVTATVAPTTAAPSPAAPTTAAPTTAPPTTAAPVLPSFTRDEVQDLVREIWPDELEERALELARRESNFVASADNGWCCVGVFQIYWSVHRGWLDDYGIATRDDLKHARKNIAAAYALYQRSGGWAPWGG